MDSTLLIMSAFRTFCSRGDVTTQTLTPPEAPNTVPQKYPTRSSGLSPMAFSPKSLSGSIVSPSASPPVPYVKDTSSLHLHKAILNDNDTTITTIHNEDTSVDLLTFQFPNGDNCLHAAVKAAAPNVIDYLLRIGIPANEQNEDGETALHLAARNGDFKTVKLLSEFNIDAKIWNNDGQTAADIAYHLKYDDIVEWLLDATDDLLGCFEERTTKEPIRGDADEEKSTAAVHVTTDSEMIDRADEFIVGLKRGDDGVGRGHNSEHSRVASLKNMNTDRLQHMASDIFLDIKETINEDKATLHRLAGWLQRKQGHPPYSWLKRWVVVQDGYLMWNEWEMLPGEKGMDAEEKKRWNKCFALYLVERVEKVTKGKTGRKFKMVVKEEKGLREYVWKTESRESRDEWVQELLHHIHVRQQEKTLIPRSERTMKTKPAGV
mmetsp:Transcript_68520/g.108822  ORF Transcript_68520/g.108822 Transcript_68520/m.108822 type:complete len:434 (-) Transcript_68520:142-1443(-)